MFVLQQDLTHSLFLILTEQALEHLQGLMQLPKHGTCCAHRLANIATTDASKLLEFEYEQRERGARKPKKTAFKWSKAIPGCKTLPRRFEPMPTDDEIFKYALMYTTVLGKIRTIFVWQSKSTTFGDEIRRVFITMFTLPTDVRWNSLADAIAEIVTKYGGSEEDCEQFNRNIEAIRHDAPLKTISWDEMQFLKQFLKVCNSSQC